MPDRRPFQIEISLAIATDVTLSMETTMVSATAMRTSSSKIYGGDGTVGRFLIGQLAAF